MAERAASPTHGTGNSVGPEKKKITPEERAAAMKFLEAAYEDAKQYIAMTEEEAEDEYRRVGKLHTYDPDNEWQKRCATVGRKYAPPKVVAPYLDEFFRYLEEDEDDYQLLGAFTAVLGS